MKVIRVELKHTNLKLPANSDYGKQMSAAVDYARTKAAERDIKFQKRVTFGGDWSGNCYLVYSSNAVRDLLVEALKYHNITIKAIEK